MVDTTTIQLSVETWQRLNSRKLPSDSFEDVIVRLLDEEDDQPTPELDHEDTKDNNREGELRHEPTVSVIDGVIDETVLKWDDKPVERRDARIESLRRALEAVKETGHSKQELQTEIYWNGDRPENPDEHPNQIPGQNERTWFRRTVRPALSTVAEYSNSTHSWHWTGRQS